MDRHVSTLRDGPVARIDLLQGARRRPMAAEGALRQQVGFLVQLGLEQRQQLSLDIYEPTERLRLPLRLDHHGHVVPGHWQIAAARHLLGKPRQLGCEGAVGARQPRIRLELALGVRVGRVERPGMALEDIRLRGRQLGQLGRQHRVGRQSLATGGLIVSVRVHIVHVPG
jgi:hypothetical protein